MVKLRRASGADAPRLAYVAELAYAPYLPRMGGLRPGPLDTDYAVSVVECESWVASVEGEVVGFVLLVAEDDAMLLENVAVLPSHQGTGVGRTLLALAEERSRAAGCSRIRLYTHESMVENQQLYERTGYVETHRAGEHGFTRSASASLLDVVARLGRAGLPPMTAGLKGRSGASSGRCVIAGRTRGSTG